MKKIEEYALQELDNNQLSEIEGGALPKLLIFAGGFVFGAVLGAAGTVGVYKAVKALL